MIFVFGYLGCLALGLTLWSWSLARRDASVVDIWWGMAFVGLLWWFRSQGPDPAWWQWFHAAIVTVWGTRLGLHIWWRGRGHGEDYRYAQMREHHGPRFWWVSLFTVFGLQATLVALLAAPMMVVQRSAELRSAGLFWVGAILWSIGFGFEAIADWQLLRFKSKSDQKGRVLDRGLWRYSRHPNYFGESVLWWGFGLQAVAVGGVWTLFSPLVITLLLLKVSGVALLEKTIASRRPEYADYVDRTSAFLPSLPRSRGSETGP